MKVFISWSGVASREVAEILADWFPKVLQGVRPFVSAKDIDKGANWTVELAKELEDAEFGVICLTPENLQSPWLHYEAGAITKSVNSRVSPVLFGIEKSAVEPPMAQLQMTSIEMEEFAGLIGSMNKVAGGSLTPQSLQETVQVWWPSLKQAIDGISVPHIQEPVARRTPEPQQPESSTTEMLTELLHRVRSMEERFNKAETGSGKSRTKSSANEELIELLTRNGLEVTHVSSTGSNMIIAQVDSPLTDLVFGGAYGELAEYSKSRGLMVRISTQDKPISFNSSGFADEPPF